MSFVRGNPYTSRGRALNAARTANLGATLSTFIPLAKRAYDYYRGQGHASHKFAPDPADEALMYDYGPVPSMDYEYPRMSSGGVYLTRRALRKALYSRFFLSRGRGSRGKRRRWNRYRRLRRRF